MSLQKGCIYITGNANASQHSTVGVFYKIFAVEIIIDANTNIIQDASCTLLTDMGQNFVRNLLINRDFIKELDVIVNTVLECFQSLLQKSLICAIKDANNKYCLYKNKITVPNKSRE